MAQSDAAFLKNKVALLADFSEEQLRALASRSEIVTPGPGEVILHAGDEVHFLAIILGSSGATAAASAVRRWRTALVR